MATKIQARNASVRNTLRITYEDLVDEFVKDKNGKDVVKKVWRPREIVGLIKANEPFELFAAHNMTRIGCIEELPT